MKIHDERRPSPRYFAVFGKFIALSAAVLLFIALNPVTSEADCDVSGDIPFTVTTSFTNSNWCFECLGPWLRDTDTIFLDVECNDCVFYAATDTILSPYGQWWCGVIQWEATAFDCSLADIDQVTTIIFSKQLCLTSSDGSANFDIKSDGSFTTNLHEAPCASSTTSFLGDNPNTQKRDTDEFSFSGSEGDEANIRLEADPAAGNNGGQAILRLEGNSLDETVSGTLPLEITAILPALGDYKVTVDQPKKSSIEGQQFKGTYVLSIALPNGGIEVITPGESTEK